MHTVDDELQRPRLQESHAGRDEQQRQAADQAAAVPWQGEPDEPPRDAERRGHAASFTSEASAGSATTGAGSTLAAHTSRAEPMAIAQSANPRSAIDAAMPPRMAAATPAPVTPAVTDKAANGTPSHAASHGRGRTLHRTSCRPRPC